MAREAPRLERHSGVLMGDCKGAARVCLAVRFSQSWRLKFAALKGGVSLRNRSHPPGHMGPTPAQSFRSAWSDPAAQYARAVPEGGNSVYPA
ncbi:hypothetical protein NDU88_004784 [Pleurodeles waltl]|uniref:Uncharacterized protein n=1 Tax=Pleurodeles waltl TaxID=8319 RepID=A0AAV7W8V4_PLEWA|nr:hypothetical protein NDU88_004784 [Pleurodeles waltl]